MWNTDCDLFAHQVYVGNDMQSGTTLIDMDLGAAAAPVATGLCLFGGWAYVSRMRVTPHVQLGTIWGKTGAITSSFSVGAAGWGAH